MRYWMCCNCCVAVHTHARTHARTHAHTHSFTTVFAIGTAGAKKLKAVLSESADVQRSVSAPVDTSSKPLVDRGDEEEDEVIISAHDTAGKGKQKQKKSQ